MLRYNPNATSMHVEMAIEDEEPLVVFSAILCPNATEDQIMRGAEKVRNTDVADMVDIEAIKSEMKRYREINEKYAAPFERLIKVLEKSRDSSLRERARKRAQE